MSIHKFRFPTSHLISYHFGRRVLLNEFWTMSLLRHLSAIALSTSLLAASFACAQDLHSAAISMIGLLPASSSHLMEAYLIAPPEFVSTKDSLVVKKFDDGSVRILRTENHGQLDELEEFYSRDGQLRSTRRYSHGQIHGTETVFQSDGKSKFIEIPWQHGHIDGDVVIYYPDGSQHIRMHYAQDTLNGNAQTFWQGGKVLSQVQYKSGKAQGVALHFTPEGQTFARSLYFQGNCIRVTRMDPKNEQSLAPTKANDELVSSVHN